MKVILEHERCVLLHGDSSHIREVLAENSIDAIVTDPPAGIDFMGKGWDSDKGGRDNWIVWLTDTLKPAFEALKPGGYALVWALPRTSHWTATALENCGFEIRDVVTHLFGTGFPKSLTSKSAEIPKGTGSALKPASEHWILARKPLEGTYAENYAKYGTGVIQIDACRIAAPGGRPLRTSDPIPVSAGAGHTLRDGLGGSRAGGETAETQGRWPANLTLDEEAATALDAQSGERSAKRSTPGKASHTERDNNSKGHENARETMNYADTGGASRFFYVAKAPRKEKDAGLGHLDAKSGGEATGREDGSAGVSNPRAGAGRTGGARNFHPTVKNLALMQWLCRLITPPGGVVLDVFAGSGSTGVAALAEGFNFVGCEQGGKDDEYLPILLGRIQHALGPQPLSGVVKPESERGKPPCTYPSCDHDKGLCFSNYEIG